MPPLIHANYLNFVLRRVRHVPHLPGWTQYLFVATVAFLAHRFVFQAAFFMDDHVFLEQGGLTTNSWMEQEGRWLPFLIWSSTAKMVGISSAAFHALNLAVHIAIACLMLPMGRYLLQRVDWFPNPQSANHAATLGALIFACHPLGTEAVHYARCFMIDLVTLECVVATWCVLKLTEKFSWQWAAGLLGMVLLAAVTKQPGVPLVMANAALIALTFANWGRIGEWKKLRHLPLNRWQWAGVFAGVGALLWLVLPWIAYALTIGRHQQDFTAHTLTQARVFWEYVQRVLVPFDLSADHYIAWSRGVEDWPAVLGLVGIVGLLGLSIWGMITKRYRGAALLLALAMAPLCLRFGYVVRELMVEYRAYPALPWIGLLMGCGLVWLRDWNRAAGLSTALVLLVSFFVLSNDRSALWTNEGNLAADVLDQYPDNMRATTLLQNEALRMGDFKLVLRLMQVADEQLLDHEEGNSLKHGRQYELNRVYQHYAVAQQYAVYAIAELRGVDVALGYADQVIEVMDKRYPGHYRDPETGAYQMGNALVQARMRLSHLAMQ